MLVMLLVRIVMKRQEAQLAVSCRIEDEIEILHWSDEEGGD